MKKTKLIVIWAFAIIAIVLQTSCVTKMRTFGKIVNAQSEAGQAIPADFINTIPFTTDETGKLMIEAQTSNGVDGLFYINTYTSSLMSAADLKRSDATLWGEWPMDLRNYYGQSSETEIYKIPSIQIAGATIDNTHWSVEPKGCKHPTIGVDILQLMCWDFDTDNGNVTISSIEDSKTIADKMKGYVCYENGLQYEKIAVKFPAANGNDKFIFDLGMGENYLEVNNNIYKKLKKIYTPEDKVIDGSAADFFPAVKCELAGATVTIPVVHYKKDGQNKIGAPLMKYFNFCIFSYKDKNERKVDLYLKRNNQPNATVR